MADKEMKNKANIGSASLILIFIVLCLATFGLLSLTSANNDWKLADKNAKAVQTYYMADSQGEEFLQMVDQTLTEAFRDQEDQDACRLALKNELGDYYQEDTGMIATEIPMDYGQVLHIELALRCGGERPFDIEAWKVVNLSDYEIDNSLPVWTGQ